MTRGWTGLQWLNFAAVVWVFVALGSQLALAVNVRQLGAVGDGMADDTAAIQRAADRGGDLVFPAGKYRITKTISLPLNQIGYVAIRGQGSATVVMEGAGPALRILGTHQGTAAPETVKADVWEKQRMPMVDSLAIVGGHPRASGIQAQGTMQLTITRVHIRQCLHGIHLVERNRNVIISNCHIYENRGVGVFYDHVDLHQSNISGCHISYNLGGGVLAIGGNVRNIHLGASDLEQNMGLQSPPTANVLIDCRGSAYGTGEVAISGCTIQHTYRAPNSANIRILGKSDRDAVREGHITIVGNVLSDAQTNVQLTDCRGATLTGNTAWQGARHNLLLERCRDVVVADNSFDRNPRYASAAQEPVNANAVVVRQCADCTLNGLIVSGVRNAEAGVLVEECQRMNITNCSILDCEGVELLIRGSRYSRVSDCILRDDREMKAKGDVLKMLGGSGNMIVNNLLSGPMTVDADSARPSGNQIAP